MRKVIVSTFISLDGYVAGPGGNVMALPIDGFFDELNLERQRSAGALLLGRTTYLGMKGWWPAVAEDPSRSPAVQLDPSTAELHRETARRNNNLRKFVVSDSLSQADTDPWSDTTSIVRRADAHATVRRLVDDGDDDLLIFGSSTLWGDLLQAGLVDELHLLVGPAALRDGVAGYGAGPVPPLHLLDVRRRKGSDSVLLTYAVDNGGTHGLVDQPT